MKPEEINRAIAELCRLKADEHEGFWQLTDGQRIYGYHCGMSEDHAWRVCCPNYYASLDACAEFEKTITYPEMDTEYTQKLLDVIKAEFKCEMPRLFALITATAPQRCEAFLRIHGKWREE